MRRWILRFFAVLSLMGLVVLIAFCEGRSPIDWNTPLTGGLVKLHSIIAVNGDINYWTRIVGLSDAPGWASYLSTQPATFQIAVPDWLIATLTLVLPVMCWGDWRFQWLPRVFGPKITKAKVAVQEPTYESDGKILGYFNPPAQVPFLQITETTPLTSAQIFWLTLLIIGFLVYVMWMMEYFLPG